MKKLITTAFMSLLFVAGAYAQNCVASYTFSVNGSTVSFMDSSSIPTTMFGASGYTWNFDDGNYGYTQNPTHTYAQAGTYVVCLTAWFIDSITPANSCQDTYCDTVVISGTGGGSVSCQASFVASPDTFNGIATGVIFSGYSGISPFLPYNVTYSWDYGDGDTGIGSWNTHDYGQAGTYIACLTVTVIDSGGAGVVCTSTYCDSVVVSGSSNPTPTFCTASYWVDTVTSSAAAINIYNNSTPLTSASYVTTYFWDFGDGSSSTQQFPTHSYASSGLYNLCLTIISVDQNLDTCTDTYCHTLGVDSLGNLYFKTNGPGFTLNILDPASIGLNETVLNDVSIYPNPSAGAVTLDLGTQLVGETTWSLYDLKGVNIANGNASDIQTTIDVSELSNGIYLLTIENGAAVSNQKLQILK